MCASFKIRMLVFLGSFSIRVYICGQSISQSTIIIHSMCIHRTEHHKWSSTSFAYFILFRCFQRQKWTKICLLTHVPLSRRIEHETIVCCVRTTHETEVIISKHLRDHSLLITILNWTLFRYLLLFFSHSPSVVFIFLLHQFSRFIILVVWNIKF